MGSRFLAGENVAGRSDLSAFFPGMEEENSD
jgi:hypothetical protein